MAIGKTFMKTPPLRMHVEPDAKKRKHRARSLLWLSHHGIAMDAYAHTAAATTTTSTKYGASEEKKKKKKTLLLKSGLSREAAELKQRIKETCPDTVFKFSFSCMRRIVTPPVAIPYHLASMRAKTTVVSGKSIPMTKAMWKRQKHQLTHRLPDRIDERIAC